MVNAGAFAQVAADFSDYLPILFVIYVIFAIISQIGKAARQAAQAQKAAASQAPASDQPQMTAADVRLALQRRLAAAAAARAQTSQAPAQAAPRAVTMPAASRITSTPAASSALPSALADLSSPGDMLQAQALPDSTLPGFQPSMDLSSLLASLPLAAQAVVASAVIGPCASHRGGGHDPEDW